MVVTATFSVTTRSVGFREVAPVLPTTPMGYERAPHALGDFVRFVSAEYESPRIYVTENGVCDPAGPLDGVIDDHLRTETLRGFLAGLAGAILWTTWFIGWLKGVIAAMSCRGWRVV